MFIRSDILNRCRCSFTLLIFKVYCCNITGQSSRNSLAGPTRTSIARIESFSCDGFPVVERAQ